jgi:threonine synthase
VLRGWMQGFEQTSELTISGELLAKAQEEMASYAVLQEEVRATIAEHNKVHRYLFDPHSAIGAAAAQHFGEDVLADKPNAAVVVVGTAHYGKFLPVVSKALGVAEAEIKQHPILKALESLPTRLSVANNSSATVAEHIRKTVAKKNQKACGECASLWSSAPTECKLATLALAAATVAAAVFVARRK